MNEPQYLVGIDLGTSNCAMACIDPARGPDAPVVDFPIPQLQQAGGTAARPLLPSALYLPSPHELPAEALRLPWDPAAEGGADLPMVIGEFARWQGARVPGRLIVSAKSWLCHAGVDRTAAILPWGAPAEIQKLSPVQASARLVAHMARAWDHAHPEAPLARQEVVITVPASFDEAARSLTVRAARDAGLERFTLVEEPQAAFYDFTARHRQDLAVALEAVRLALVVDVGGGTSDFTLVQVGATPSGPALRRIAVGEHLMLGGDNMDAALSRKAEERMLAAGRKLSPAQWSQLAQMARVAKESLLSGNGPDQYNLSVVGEGSRLVGRSLSTHLTREEAERIILAGFFPACGPEESPSRGGRVALQELGLPYAQDPAITRHLAAFLRAHGSAGLAALDGGEAPSQGGRKPGLPRPDAILLNGGVFNSVKIAARLVEVVSGWWPGQPPVPLLRHESLELAVARGAAYYGLARRGLGRRIAGGAAHALYVGLETRGGEGPLALCVIPRGQEEGESIDLGGRVFHLAVGQPVRFPLFSTTSDRFEKSGEVVPVAEDMEPLPPIHTVLKGAGACGDVPVHLRATLTEIGTLELWCVSETGRERWRLEFELRGAESSEAPAVVEPMPAGFDDARWLAAAIFGGKRPPPSSPSAGGAKHHHAGARPADPKDARQLWPGLERTLGPREEWRPPVLRELWSTLYAGAAKRRRSAEHERVFFQLLGYSLRPGFGYPLDEWRCEQTASLFEQSVEFHKEKAVWKEFWILWRRIAGGLSPARQEELWGYLKPQLAARIPPQAPKNIPRPKGVQPEDLDEMARLAAALEHLGAADKTELGGWIAARIRSSESAAGPWAWALGRLGARAPIYGSAHKTIAPDQAKDWVSLLLEPRQLRLEGALFALTQLARRTGDRTRDLDETSRRRVLEALRSANASPSWERMVAEVVELGAADKARALGDTLPVGLKLVEERGA